jgi:cyclophilin family peptidyl-prolyl cis-trans isomerase
VADFVIQDGDPRGDGEGAPGYTIRDELNERPYLRGTVGMALDPWPDTGGSQYFIAHSPQPHLDARYTVFGRVIAGMDVVDKIQQWDVIRRSRVGRAAMTDRRSVTRDVEREGFEASGSIGGKLKRGRRPPPFIDGRGRLTVSCRPSSSRPWLSSPLSVIPPFMLGLLRERSRASSWLPPGTLTRCRRPSLRVPPDAGCARSDSDFQRGSLGMV